MSISSINSYGNYQAGGGHQQRKQEIDALSQALQSGDLSSAQQAFSTLFNANGNQASSSSNSNCGGGGGASDGVVADISALGKALSSGDLSSAQSAFSSLQDDMQSAPPPPPSSPQNQASGKSDSSSASSAQSLFEQLAEALQSGDLSSAQTAFDSLQANAPTNKTSSSDSSDPFSSDIASLSTALGSGDISSAQTAFAQLQKDLQNAPPPPPPGGPNGGGPGGNGDQVQQAFSDLAKALQNNDLSSAQTVFSTLQSLAPANQSDSTSSTSGVSINTNSSSANATDTIGTDLGSLSDALQSGDLSSAQTLFQSLLEDLQAGAPRHPGVHQYSQNSSSAQTSSSVSISA